MICYMFKIRCTLELTYNAMPQRLYQTLVGNFHDRYRYQKPDRLSEFHDIVPKTVPSDAKIVTLKR